MILCVYLCEAEGNRGQEAGNGFMKERIKEAQLEKGEERREVDKAQLQLRMYKNVKRKYASSSANYKHEIKFNPRTT